MISWNHTEYKATVKLCTNGYAAFIAVAVDLDWVGRPSYLGKVFVGQSITTSKHHGYFTACTC